MSNKKYPKITIITPVLNSKDTIEKAIISLINQKYPNLEFLIFDGKSTDGTLDIINKYKKHITYFESKKDKGPNAIYNKGIDLASGDIIAFLNSDDWYENNILFDVADHYNEHPDADMFSCGFRLVTKHYDKYRDIRIIKESALNINLKTILESGAVTNARFIRNDIYKKYGKLNCFDAKGNYLDSADTEFFFNLSLLNIKNIIIHKIGYSSLKHPNSRTHNNNFTIKKRLYAEHISLVERFFKEKTLNKNQIKLFHYWYATEVIKLILLKLITMDLKYLSTLFAKFRYVYFTSIMCAIKKVIRLLMRKINIYNSYK